MTSRVWVLVVLASAVGAAAGAHPAGWRPADLVLTGAFAGVVTLAGAYSRRWTWLVLAGVAAVAGSAPFALACAVGALAVALACVVRDRESRIAGAVVAGLAVQSLLRLRGFGFHGAPSLVAVAAVVPLFVSAYRSAPDRGRAIARRAALAVGVVGLVFVGLAVVTGFQARNKIQRAVQEAQAGFDAVQSGDRANAIAQLGAAEASFRDASDSVDAWWARPVRAVPVAGQQMAAVDAMAHEGHALTATASTGVAQVDYDNLRLRNGAIDLDALRAAQQPVTQAVDALDQAQTKLADISGGWLVPPLRDRYKELQADIEKSLASARAARDVVAVGPEFLGQDGPKHYVVLFGTPSETRELGGLVGNYAEVTADNGKLTLTRSGRSVDLSDRNGERGVSLAPGPLLDRYAPYQVTRFFQNVSGSPDFPEVADITDQIYPQIFGEKVDGVFYMDPYALAALLSLTGPVTLPTSHVTLDSRNAAQILMVDQYAQGETQGRVDFLDEATRLTFEKLTSGDLPKPSRVSQVMDPMVTQGRLLGFSPSGDVEGLFRELGLDGTFPDPHAGDFFSVTQSNLGANKIDPYLQRAVTYSATYDPSSGKVDSTLTVQLHNTATADGLSDLVVANIHGLPRGTNQSLLTVNTPLALDSASVGGQPAPVSPVDRFGVHSYSVEVDVPPGGSQTLEVHLHGLITPSSEYRLTVARQPTYQADTIGVQIAGSAGFTVTGSPQFDVSGGRGTATVGDDRLEVLTATFGPVP